MNRRVLLMVSSMRGGGSERQTLLLLKNLDRKRFTPHLYLTERAGDFLDQVPSDVSIHSFADVRQEGGLYFPGRKLREQSDHVASVVSSQSIDVVYDRTFHMTMVAGRACRQMGTPRVSTIVSPPHRALPLVEKRFVRLKRRKLARAYRNSKSVVAVSRQAARSAEGFYGLKQDSVQVIENPVDVATTQQMAARLTVPRDERLTLACVGRMTPEKGHADLIAAIHASEKHWPKDLPTIQLWLIGDGPLRDSLEAQCNIESQGVHSIDFLGVQKNSAPYIAAADALVLPSHFEGMPNVVLEAMALGTPVIATRAGGTVELEKDEPTILWAEPSQSDSLESCIREFAKDWIATPSKASERANAALRMIHKHHDVTIQTRRIESLLDEARL